MIRINGEEINTENIIGKSVLQYLLDEGYKPETVVTERNLTIISREELGKTIIEDGDEIEILRFMGGGQ